MRRFKRILVILGLSDQDKRLIRMTDVPLIAVKKKEARLGFRKVLFEAKQF